MNMSAKASGIALAVLLFGGPCPEPSEPARNLRMDPAPQLRVAPAVIGNWSAPAHAVEAWEVADPNLTGRFFSPGSRNAIPHAGIGGGNAVSYASVRRFVQDVARLPRGSTVMYDPEPWRHTPILEQTHPRRAMRRPPG